MLKRYLRLVVMGAVLCGAPAVAKVTIWNALSREQALIVAQIAEQCARMPYFEITAVGTSRRIPPKHGDGPRTIEKKLVDAGIDLVCSDQMMTSAATGKVVSTDPSTPSWVNVGAITAGVPLK